jgi:lysyl-tRNA synthetase class 1
VFRKVPKDMPRQEELEACLGRSIVDVLDPWGCHDSYAAHHIATFESSLEPLGIRPEFIRQHGMYRKGAYAAGIRAALAGAEKLRGILNGARREHGAHTLLGEEWLPLGGFCDRCGKDDLACAWDGAWGVHVTCRTAGCAASYDVDLRAGGNLKLPWRVDWPMRWGHERVSFEPGGKDHSSAGGSYDTARHIVRELYDWTAPEYVGYDFVLPKGQGGKFSSSRGGAFTVADCLTVYEPELLRWIFASYRPNTEFQISFDLDVIKLYEDYDRAVRLAHEAEDGGKNDSKRQIARRTLHLASVDHVAPAPGSAPPWRPAFRPLSVVLQIFDGDLERARAHYVRTGELPPGDPGAVARFDARARCVWNWITDCAPEDFRYRIRAEAVVRPLAPGLRTAVEGVVSHLRSRPDADDAAWAAFFKSLGADDDGAKAVYPVLYDLLVGRDHGPKLSTLLATMSSERALRLIEPSLG